MQRIGIGKWSLLQLWSYAWVAVAIGAEPVRPPLVFEPAHGAQNSEVEFIARGPGYTVALLRGGAAVYALTALGEDDTVRMELIGAQPANPGRGEVPRESQTRYYSGSVADKAVPHYSRVRFERVYPGVDLVWQDGGGELEYRFVLRPAADPNCVRIWYHGARRLFLDGTGHLHVETASGTVRFRPPSAFQARHEIPVKYNISGDVVSFELGEYDPRLPLVIDPVLTTVTYLGGAGFDAAYGIAVDSGGNVYVTGETASIIFPSTAGGGYRTNRDAFVTKLSPDASRVLYTTILSGAGNDAARALVVDAAGQAYIAGVTGSRDFPVTAAAVQTTAGGGDDAFVTKLDVSGRVLFCTYLGAGGVDVATGLALGIGGEIYVSGYTGSLRFPVTPAVPQSTYAGGSSDAFVAKLNASGTAVVYSTFLGGSGSDQARGIAVGLDGRACIVGRTDSANIGATQIGTRAGGDALAACLNAAGTGWVYVATIGGTSADEGYSIAVDSGGGATITGATFSHNFPVTTGAFQPANRGDYDAFVVKLGPAGNALVFGTLLGGSGADSGTALAVDGAGRIWITGFTGSSDLPLPTGSQTRYSGSFDVFICQLSGDGAVLLYAAYAGGAADDRAWGAVLDGTGRLWIAGASGSIDLPATTGALQRLAPASYNGFVIQVSSPPPVISSFQPASGRGTSQVFTLQATDVDGASDVKRVQILFNTGLSGVRACLINYTVAAGYVYLLNDAGDAFLPGQRAGTAGSLGNSQCSIDVSGVSAASQGNTLRLRIPVVFRPAFAGAKAVLAEVVDAKGLGVGSWWAIGQWVVENSDLPLFVSLTPSSGKGSTQVFTIAVSDGSGGADINRIQILFNTGLLGGAGCLVNYTVISGDVYLLNDAGTAFLPPAKAGTSTFLRNSQCSVDVRGVSAGASGNVLSVVLPMSFLPGFAGAKLVLGEVMDRKGFGAGQWYGLGTWMVENSDLPLIGSFSRTAGPGATQVFSIGVADGAGAEDILRVQLLVNGGLSAANGCLLNYTASGYIYLLNDAGTAFLSPARIGTAAMLENTQCSISVAAVSAAMQGSTLTLTLPITFRAGFSGQRTAFIEVIDRKLLGLYQWYQVANFALP